MELTNDQQILQSIVKKAWQDPVFKSDLTTNPVATIENFLGHPIHLPEGKSIAVVDQSNSSTIFINIPAEPNTEDMELNEEQLDAISGGELTPPVIIRPNNYDGTIFGGN
jgi:hypothetical protein